MGKKLTYASTNMPLASAYLGLGNYKKSEELLLQNIV